jgi:signal transduction histidine kinase
MDHTAWIAALGGLVTGAAVPLLLRARETSRTATLAGDLERARAAGAQREGLLHAVVEEAPLAILLLGGAGTIFLANPAARELFFEGEDPVGENLLVMLGRAPAPFREALLGHEDALFSVGDEGDDETYHLVRRGFEAGGEPVTLVLVRHVTREMRRKEVAVWKKLLRVISHELNNSLAPISSMARSARLIAGDPGQIHRLDKVFATIEERAAHLKGFLEGYAALARLPLPRRAHVPWAGVLARAAVGFPDVAVGEAPLGTGYFDEAQIEQVVMNLLKNAREAGGEGGTSVDVERAEGGFRLVVRDRGPGMSDDVLRSAMLPFYSTKERGTGLGLALCREILEAHGGRIHLANREGGGLEVACFVPDADAPRTKASRLTITRA